jgi:predicted dinucleotide-binding enzyme
MPVEALAGKIVLDTNNYMIWRDGNIPVIDSGEKTVHQLRQEQLPTSKVVQAFTHIRAPRTPPQASHRVPPAAWRCQPQATFLKQSK